MIFDQVFVRHWDTWKDGRRNHVFRVPIGEDGAAGTPVDLMPGVDGDCPTIPWGGDDDFTVSPDDAWLVYTAKVVDGSEEVWSTDWDLWAVPTDGSQPAPCLTEDNQAWDASPAFSPDGRPTRLSGHGAPGLRGRSLPGDGDGLGLRQGQQSDRTLGPLAGIGGVGAGREDALRLGRQRRQPLHLPHRSRRRHGVGRCAPATPTRARSRWPTAACSLPATAWCRRWSSSSCRPVAASRGRSPISTIERLAAIAFGGYKQFSFPGANDDEVFGYFIYPVDFDPQANYPLAFLIHGGPQGSFDDHWHYRWNPQIYAGHGYATVMIDFHGSTGYGQDFTDAINGDWGGAPFEDLMKGLDHVLRAPPVDRLRPDGGRGRQLRRLHDQLDPGPHRSLQGPGLPRRQPRRAHGLLRHRGAVVPRVGARRHAVGEPRTATASTRR